MASILHLMSELKYPTDEEGICFGLALMAERARRLNEYDKFKRRMTLLDELKKDEIKPLIQNAQKKNSEGCDLFLMAHNKPYKNSTLNQLYLYKNEKNKLFYLKNNIEIYLEENEFTRSSAINTLKFEEKSENPVKCDNTEFVDNILAITSKRGDTCAKRKLLTVEEEILLEIEAFFFQAWIHFLPNAVQNFLGLSGRPALNQFDFKIAEQLIFENPLLPDFQSYFLLETLSDNVKNTELKTEQSGPPEIKNNYINHFLETIKNSKEPMGLMIGSYDHAIHVFYDKEQSHWFVTNHSTLIKHPSDANLAQILHSIFKESYLNMRVFTVDTPTAETKILLDKLKAIETSVVCDNINKKDCNGVTPLYLAAKWNCYDTVKTLLLDKNVQVNEADKYNQTPLYIAASRGYLEILKVLMSHPETEINILNNSDTTPLHIAAANGHINIVKALLNNAKIAENAVNQADKNGMTPLHSAAANGHIDVVHYLLNHPKILENSINTHNNQGTTPLHSAAANGHLDVVIALLNHPKIANNAAIDANLQEESPLHSAAANGHIAVVKYLFGHPSILENISIINKIDKNGKSPLHSAIENGHAQVVKFFLEYQYQTNINLVLQGWTPLALAAKSGHVDVVKVFFESKNSTTDFNQGTTEWDTPLALAVAFGKTEVVKLFLESHTSNIEVNKRKRTDEWTPMTIAVANGRTEIVKLFLESNNPKIDPNLVGGQGFTPLALAVRSGKIELVKLFCESNNTKLDLNLGFEDWNPLALAAKYGHVEIVKLFLANNKVNPNQLTPDGLTPLEIAAKYNQGDVIKTFLESTNPSIIVNPVSEEWTPIALAVEHGSIGAIKAFLESSNPHIDPNQATPDDWTPLTLAARFGKVEIVKLFLESQNSKVDPNQATPDGWTPLALAAKYGQIEVVKAFIESKNPKVNLTLPTPDGWTPLALAKKANHTEIIALLENAQNSLTKNSQEDKTPAMNTAQNVGSLTSESVSGLIQCSIFSTQENPHQTASPVSVNTPENKPTEIDQHDPELHILSSGDPNSPKK